MGLNSVVEVEVESMRWTILDGFRHESGSVGFHDAGLRVDMPNSSTATLP